MLSEIKIAICNIDKDVSYLQDNNNSNVTSTKTYAKAILAI